MIASREFCDRNRLDELYSPSEYEDVDLSQQAVTCGYDLVQLRPGLVHHIGGQTFGYSKEREKRTHANRLKFMEKWEIEDE